MSEQQDILEILQFMQQNMVTKVDLRNELSQEIGSLRIEIKEELKRFATKDDLMQMKSEIMTSVDHLAKRHETFDHELLAMRAKYERLDERLEIVEAKVGVAA